MVLLSRTPALRYDEDPHAAGRHAAEAVAHVNEYHAHQGAINPPITDPEALQRAADLEGMQAAKSLSMAAIYRKVMDETMPVRVSTQASHEVTAADFPDLRSGASPAQPVASPQNRASSASIQMSPTEASALSTATPVTHAAAVKREPGADEVIIIEDDIIAAVKMEPIDKEVIVVEDDPAESDAGEAAPPSDLTTRFKPYVPNAHLPSNSKRRAHVTDDISPIKRESPRPQAVRELSAATDQLPVSHSTPPPSHAEVDSRSRKRPRVAEDTLPIKRESTSPHAVLQVPVATEEIGISDQDELPGHAQTSQPHRTLEPQAELNGATAPEQREQSEEYEPFDDVITAEEHALPELLKELEQFRRSQDFAASQEQPSLEQPEQLQHAGGSVENASPEQHTTAEKRQHCAEHEVLMPTREATEYDVPGGLQKRTHEEPTIPTPPLEQAEAAVQRPPRERSVETPASVIAPEHINLNMIEISHLSVHLTDEHCTASDAKARLNTTFFKTVAKNENTGLYLGLAMWGCSISYWVIRFDRQGMADATPVTLSKAVMMPKQLIECHLKLEAEHGYHIGELLDENEVNNSYMTAFVRRDRPRPEDMHLVPDWVQESYAILDEQRDRASGMLTERSSAKHAGLRKIRENRRVQPYWYRQLVVLKKKKAPVKASPVKAAPVKASLKKSTSVQAPPVIIPNPMMMATRHRTQRPRKVVWVAQGNRVHSIVR
ncbi:hypothetical protein LTR95_011972 [Oleoguttula sp. CCFEE 5521]